MPKYREEFIDSSMAIHTEHIQATRRYVRYPTSYVYQGENLRLVRRHVTLAVASDLKCPPSDGPTSARNMRILHQYTDIHVCMNVFKYYSMSDGSMSHEIVRRNYKFPPPVPTNISMGVKIKFYPIMYNSLPYTLSYAANPSPSRLHYTPSLPYTLSYIKFK